MEAQSLPYTQFRVASYEIKIVSHLNSIKNANIHSYLFQNSTVEQWYHNICLTFIAS